ncbi:MAG TPA: toxin-antitoxin system HicB family antitoxin [Candidatus Monoglobus merdigallinarum]|uniref:Toxin-antitoxin system HicB family antitoxin n=1 Tax=Candidatus Monoglobus merdigallinarum TaxID=2838698 RepID=A0A9D1PQ24_9FIRM|nr:toxin-antitoxin system HicB family antitoxin [Candidatus Monoglobus merdigallinarum]
MDFIIKKPKSSNRTIRMPDELIERIAKLAADRGISFNQLVIQCCEFALEHLKGPESDEKKQSG